MVCSSGATMLTIFFGAVCIDLACSFCFLAAHERCSTPAAACSSIPKGPMPSSTSFENSSRLFLPALLLRGAGAASGGAGMFASSSAACAAAERPQDAGCLGASVSCAMRVESGMRSSRRLASSLVSLSHQSAE